MSDTLLVIAGIGGMLIAMIHGYIGQTKILPRIAGLSPGLNRINGAVFQLSTLYWFVGGAALTMAPLAFEPAAKSMIAGTVAFLYITAAIANLWATRGRHFGWTVLMAVAALILLAF